MTNFKARLTWEMMFRKRGGEWSRTATGGIKDPVASQEEG
jgi:hypothetical protein